MIVSTEGGMSIEDVAHDTPEKITTLTIDPATGFMPHHGRSVAAALKLEGDRAKAAAKLAKQLYDAFIALDGSMIEINPLVETAQGEMLVLDAKVSFDSNAEFRHAELEALRDVTEEDPMEVEAAKHDLAYIKLDGDIGCMVNGAGLAMATMDIIKLNGAFPANFCDVGGVGQDDLERRGARNGADRAAGGAARGDQRRARQGNPRQLGARDHPRRGSGRRRQEDRRRGEAGGLA